MIKEDVVIQWNKLLEQLGELGNNEETQQEAIKLFKENRNWIWEFLLNCDEARILKELEVLTNNKGFTGSIIQIFVIVKFEARIRQIERERENNA